MLGDVKTALRIRHDRLDYDIEGCIEVAKKEMQRLGISEDMTESGDPLIRQCIKTYCLAMFTSDKLAEGYFKSFQYQLDNLSKTAKYRGDVDE